MNALHMMRELAMITSLYQKLVRWMAVLFGVCALVGSLGCQNGNNAVTEDRWFVERFDCINQLGQELARAQAEPFTSRQMEATLGSPDVKVPGADLDRWLIQECGDDEEKRVQISAKVTRTWEAGVAMQGSATPSSDFADASIWFYRWSIPRQSEIVIRGALFEHTSPVSTSYFVIIHEGKAIACSSVSR